MIAPASFIRVTIVASREETKSLKSAEPYVVGMSLVSTWSFSSTGTQCRGPVGAPDCNAWSRESANSSARGFRFWTVLSRGPTWSYAAMRSR